ncbi:hypothetical protein MLD38_013714 [Melastoma candidum]|uniref:Uncharacterized protein n=1 Tax=Melastoma candidum TaxID=119954 RepID=A0ACB9RAG0_9MYRT|nr:hypothetical protein MLD38_013714 [Melastoma candidum]
MLLVKTEESFLPYVSNSNMVVVFEVVQNTVSTLLNQFPVQREYIDNFKGDVRQSSTASCTTRSLESECGTGKARLQIGSSWTDGDEYLLKRLGKNVDKFWKDHKSKGPRLTYCEDG